MYILYVQYTVHCYMESGVGRGGGILRQNRASIHSGGRKSEGMDVLKSRRIEIFYDEIRHVLKFK